MQLNISVQEVSFQQGNLAEEAQSHPKEVYQGLRFGHRYLRRRGTATERKIKELKSRSRECLRREEVQ
jgi:hypothetical protein